MLMENCELTYASNLLSVGTCNKYYTYLVLLHLKTYSKPIYAQFVLYYYSSTFHFSYTDTCFLRIFEITIFLFFTFSVFLSLLDRFS